MSALHERSSDTASFAPEHRLRPRQPLELRRAGGIRTWMLVAVIAVVAAVVQARGMYTAPIRFDDEGTYVSQARAILVDGSLSPYTYWYDHPPLGWMLIAAWLAGPGALLPAPHLIGDGRQFMLVLGVLSAMLVFFLARRVRLTRAAATGAALLFALSPLAVAYHRMVLLDNIVTPLILGSFVLAMSRRRRLAAAFLAGLLLAAAVLVKLTAVLFAPFIIWVLWRTYAGPTRRMSATMFGIGAALPALLFPVFALIKGELIPREGRVSLWEGIWFQLVGRPDSGSVLNAGDDAYAVVQGWLGYDPWLIVMGAALAIPALISRRLRPFALAMMFLLVMMLRPGYLPMPYVVAMLPLAALLVAGVIDLSVRWLVQEIRDGRTVLRTASSLGALAAVTVASSVLVLVPMMRDWTSDLRRLATVNMDLPYNGSTAWLLANVEPGEMLVVDNVTWTDLVREGYPEDTLIWFNRLDNDEAVQSAVGDWRNVDWIVSTEVIRNSPTNGLLVKQLLDRSTPVAGWGWGDTRIVVGRVGVED
jgi:4-amino-4-deoxy-L-arabinose transferase-like glycosyltransferase